MHGQEALDCKAFPHNFSEAILFIGIVYCSLLLPDALFVRIIWETFYWIGQHVLVTQ